VGAAPVVRVSDILYQLEAVVLTAHAGTNSGPITTNLSRVHRAVHFVAGTFEFKQRGPCANGDCRNATPSNIRFKGDVKSSGRIGSVNEYRCGFGATIN